MRLIDADAISYEEWECGDITLYITNKESIDALPTVEAVPVVHGRWIKTGRWGRVYRCDQCGNYLDFDGVNVGRGDANYCPNCGADMRGEQDG